MTLKSFNPNIKIILGPLIVLMIIAFLTFFVGTNGYSRVKTKLDEYNSAKEKETALNKKLDSIRTIGKQVLESSDIVIVTLPQKNPASLILSRLKANLTDTQSTMLKISSTLHKDENSIGEMSFNLEVENADLNSVVTLLEKELASLPLVVVKGVRSSANEQELTYASELDLSFYWSELPTSLPPLIQPVVELTDSQLELLGKISALEQPSFTALFPSEPSDRASPF